MKKKEKKLSPEEIEKIKEAMEKTKEVSKEEKKEKPSEEGLEEKIIREIPFNQNIPVNIETPSNAPVLKSAEKPAWQTNLEENINRNFDQNNEIQNAPVYSTQEGNKNEVKYYSPPVLKPVEFSEDSGKKFFFDPLAGRRAQNFGMEPDIIGATEFEQETRRLPFEKRERKYKNVKL